MSGSGSSRRSKTARQQEQQPQQQRALPINFKVVESAYPFVIGRLLDDPSPDMRKILRELLIRNDGSIRWNRLERLVAAISKQSSESDAKNPEQRNSANPLEWKSFNMRAVVASTEDLFQFIFSEKGFRVRVYLVRDIIEAVDIFLRDEAGCIFDEDRAKGTTGTEGHVNLARMVSGFRSFQQALKLAPDIWTGMLIRLAVKQEFHKLIMEVISALTVHLGGRIHEDSWICISRILHKLAKDYNP